jgi:hypothetical protein
MERKGRLRNNILKLASYAAMICGCSKAPEQAMIRINFHEADVPVRSMSPDEDKITDISLIIFDESGQAEDCIWLTRGSRTCSIDLVVDKKYTFCACANFGYQIYAGHIEELQNITYHLAYPDEYREGIPMAAVKEVLITEECIVDIDLQRLMAKISLRMDRSRLDRDVEMNVRSARIGNCPRYVKPFTASKIEDNDDTFPTGYLLNDIQTAELNYNIGEGLSSEVSLYMLENMQGPADGNITHDSEKVFEQKDKRSEVCSYIEMEIEYLSPEKASGEKGLIYRFYLGEDRNSFDVERNTHYHITVTPENNGLNDDGWRVDKSGLKDRGPAYLRAYPSDYIRGDIGDQVHIWCEFSPASAPFDVGISYMEDDKAEGIYDYRIDTDGHGATLTLTGPGRGLIYMEAGEPVNDAALFIIEVNQP